MTAVKTSRIPPFRMTVEHLKEVMNQNGRCTRLNYTFLSDAEHISSAGNALDETTIFQVHLSVDKTIGT